MRIFGSDRMDGMLQKLGLEQGEAIIHPWINKAIEKAQQKVEARNFDMRKNVLKYDNVMNDQRKVVFEQRRDFMAQESVRETVDEMREGVIDDLVARYIPQNAYAEQWDVAALHEQVREVLNLDVPVEDWAKEEGIADEEMRERLLKAAETAYAERAEKNGTEITAYIEKQVLLQTLDHLWREHLVTLDHLRQVIGWRGFAQRDPLNEYKSEAFDLFNNLITALREQVTTQLSRVEIVHQQPTSRPSGRHPGTAPDVRPASRPGHRRERDGLCRARLGQRWRRRSGLRLRRARARGRRRRAGTRPERCHDLGPGRAQRAVPLRLGQEVQALPRHLPGLSGDLPMAARAVFVAGAGTEIGKTYVTAALTRRLRAQGRPVRTLKPLASGVPPLSDPAFAESDTARLLDAQGSVSTTRRSRPAHPGGSRPASPRSGGGAGGPVPGAARPRRLVPGADRPR